MTGQNATNLTRSARLMLDVARMPRVLGFLLLIFCLALSPFVLGSSCSASAGGPACIEGHSFGSNQPAQRNGQYVGNPVNMITGNKYQSGLDFRTADSLLMFKRHYNSINAGFNIGLGPGWRSTYDVSIEVVSRNTLRLIQSDGRIIQFHRSSAESAETDQNAADKTGKFRPADAYDGLIELVDKGFKWSLPDGRQFHFKGTILTRITTADGRWITLFYKNQRLQRVTDDVGRVLRLIYSESGGRVNGLGQYQESSDWIGWPGHLEAIELPDGRRVEYRYDSRRQLVNVRYLHGTDTRYQYAPGIYSGLLTGLLENNSMISQWQYDGSARVSRFDSEQVGVQLNFEYRVDDASGSSGSTFVADQAGTRTKYKWRRAERSDSSEKKERTKNTKNREVQEDVVGSTTRHTVDESNYSIHATVGPRCIGCPRFEVAEAVAEVIAKSELQENSTQSVVNKLRLSTSKTISSNLAERGLEVLEFDSLGYPARVRVSDPERHSMNPDDDLGVAAGTKYDVKFDTRGNILQLINSEIEEETIQFRTGNSEKVAPAMSERRRMEITNIGLDIEASIETQASDGVLNTLLDLLNPFHDQSCAAPSRLSCEELAQADFYLDFAACAYSDSDDCVVADGWERVDPERAGVDGNWDITEFLTMGEFAATIYYNPAEQRVIIAYRGSNGNLPIDYLAGVRIFSGYTEEQAFHAADLANEINRLYPNMTIGTTGHSLGGGLAVIGAAAIAVEGTVFSSFGVARQTSNIVGVNPATDAIVDHYSVSGDLVVEGPEGLGYDPVRGNNFAMSAPLGESWNGLEAHSHANVSQSIDFHQALLECPP